MKKKLFFRNNNTNLLLWKLLFDELPFTKNKKKWDRTSTKVEAKYRKNCVVINKESFSYKEKGVYESTKNPERKMQFVLVTSLPDIVVKSKK